MTTFNFTSLLNGVSTAQSTATSFVAQARTNIPNIGATVGGFTTRISDTVQTFSNGLQSGASSGRVDVFQTPSPAGAVGVANVPDLRVRLRALPTRKVQVYGPDTPDNVMQILHSTDGVLFPYTPNITVSQDVDYQSVNLVHTNMDLYAYNRTPSVSLTVSGKFTIQNQREARYAIAVLHFFRVVSKMHFGQTDPNAGLPPPMLHFHGYGTHMFNNLRVIVKSHSYTLDETVDFVTIKLPNGTARLPALFTLQTTLAVTQTPKAMREKFNLEQFRTGKLMEGFI